MLFQKQIKKLKSSFKFFIFLAASIFGNFDLEFIYFNILENTNLFFEGNEIFYNQALKIIRLKKVKFIQKS